MNRLQRELQRLYEPQAATGLGLDLEPGDLVDAQGRVRAMVLELAGLATPATPANWTALAAVWGGVQTDLALPAPAIAVNGMDGYQLWFSLLQPVPAPQAAAFLDALRRRYLGHIAPARVAMLPALNAASTRAPLHARPVPALQADSTLWSAFVAPDLAPMFADEPWLDLPPNPDGQANLLASLKIISPAEFERALQQLTSPKVTVTATPELTHEAPAQTTAALDAKRFLLDVMNNPGVDLALRIQAAKALLPYSDTARGQ